MPAQPVALTTHSLQYENSIGYTLCRFLCLPSSSRFRLLFAVAQIFHLSEKSSSQRGFLVDFLHPSTHPSSPQRPLHRVNVVSQEPSFFVKFSVSSSSYYSPILDRLSIHSRLLVYPSASFFFALWVSMFRDLCSVRHFLFSL